jgi:hypothetical protein
MERFVAYYKALSQHLPGGTEKTTKILSGQPILGQDSKL